MDHLTLLNIYKSMGLRFMELVVSLWGYCLSSWQSLEVPDGWKKADVLSIFKKSKKEDSETYTLVSLTLFPGKVMEQILLEAIS